jgi:branched-subunit amino acid aminotransferase/4-amino-4-deoxychorismate lyase
LWTPPLDGRILPGVTRARVLRSARRRGLRVIEARLPGALLAAAEEVFVTSSVRGVAPIVRLDDRPVGEGAPGPLTRAARTWAPT